MISNDRKLSRGVLAAYVFSSFATNSLWMLNNYFLLFFYTDVIEIPSAAATVILLIARVWDAVNDPMMGVLCDKTHHKEGRSRFWLRRLAVPAGLCVAFSYICPGWATPAKVVWVGVTYILQGMAQTAIGVPQSSLRVSLTSNRTERIKLSQYMAVPSAFANFLIPAMTMPFVRQFSNYNTGFAILAIAIGILYGASTFAVWKATDGYDPDTSYETGSTDDMSRSASEKEPGALELIREGIQNKYTVMVCLSYFTYMLLSGIMGSTLIYYFRYNLQNEDLMSVYSTTVMIGSLGSIFLMRLFGKRFGNAMTCMIGGVFCLIAFGARIVTDDRVLIVFVVALILTGIGSGFVSNMIHQCILDATTYGKLHGMDNQSVVMSLFTFVQKFGQAVSSVIAAGLLTAFHYTKGDTPTDTIMKLFYAENILIPVVIAVIMMLLLLVVNRMEKQMLKDLQAQN